MNNYLAPGLASLMCAILSGCALGCQAGSMTCGLTREEADRLLHPKTYGEYWVKSGVTRENWRTDWVACGGMPNGNYASDAPQGSSTATIQASSAKFGKALAECMRAKGYEYQP